MADFIVETKYERKKRVDGTWKISVDGITAQTGTGVGMTFPEGGTFKYAVRFGFKASNIEAEYEAALAGIYRA